MSKADKDAILQAAAKSLAWELYAAAGYGRARTPGLFVARSQLGLVGANGQA